MNDEYLAIVVGLIGGLIVGLYIGYDFSSFSAETLANSPELRQCLSQSGTTWQGGECVIILNK